MKYLLDTHIILWALIDDPHLPKSARELILDPENQIYYSSISPWEIEIKHQKRPKEIMITGKQLTNLCEQAGFINLSIRNSHVDRLEDIRITDATVTHNDPFDKMLLAQAIAENMILLTHDKKFSYYSDIHLLLC